MCSKLRFCLLTFIAIKYNCQLVNLKVQGGLNMTGTNCDLFTHNQSRSYLNHLVDETKQTKRT
jgi:hypothetical protein